jgi:hypothetical protein
MQVFSISSAFAAAEIRKPFVHAVAWPSELGVTANFWQATTSPEADAQHWRNANNTLCFSDGSALLISEREAEHLLATMRAASQQQCTSMTAVLANLAFLKQADLTRSQMTISESVPLAIGGTLPLISQHKVPVAAMLAFGGATQFWDGATDGPLAPEADARRDALTSLLQSEESTHHDADQHRAVNARERQQSAAAVAQAAQDLIAWRCRKTHWAGSQLQAVCRKLTATARSEEVRQPMSN